MLAEVFALGISPDCFMLGFVLQAVRPFMLIPGSRKLHWVELKKKKKKLRLLVLVFKAGHCVTGSTKLVTSIPKKHVPMHRSDVMTVVQVGNR